MFDLHVDSKYLQEASAKPKRLHPLAPGSQRKETDLDMWNSAPLIPILSQSETAGPWALHENGLTPSRSPVLLEE